VKNALKVHECESKDTGLGIVVAASWVEICPCAGLYIGISTGWGGQSAKD
jgi:hypothetical protein